MASVSFSDWAVVDGERIDPSDLITNIHNFFDIYRDIKDGSYRIRGTIINAGQYTSHITIYESEDEERRNEVFEKIKTALRAVVI